MWVSLTTFLTPTFLFLLLNSVIATIAIISHLGSHNNHHHHPPPPSLLHRVKSFNFSLYNNQPVHLNSDPPPQLAGAPSVLNRLKSNLSSLCRSDSSVAETPPPENSPALAKNAHEVHVVARSQSDSGIHSPAPAMSIRRRLTKSLSEKLGWATAEEEEEEGVERRRPQTSRAEAAEDGGEVNARADDFINRFKQQLKLQRLESLLRNREMMKKT